MIGWYVTVIILSILTAMLIVTLIHALMYPEGIEDEFILDD